MAPTQAFATAAHARGQRHEPDTRPVAFLVSTTTAARGIRESLGSAAYSYYFVAEALAPVLEKFGTWRLVDHPESRLAFAARRAEAEGYRPVHLAVNPLQDVYLSPALPNVLLPFWEFPDLPDRSFGDDVRQDWVRTSRPAALMLAACRFTADAFRRAGVRCPVAVVPVPLDPSTFAVPDWDRGHTWTLTCRHEVLGPPPEEGEADAPEAPTAPEGESPHAPAGGLKRRAWLAARAAFRRAIPWLPPRLVTRITLTRRWLAAAPRRPDAFLYVACRDAYRATLRGWLSPAGAARVTAVKRRALALVGREPALVPDPPLPSGALTLGGGLVYLTVFNVGDPRKNPHDLLTAFLSAFRDRPDVTLVVKLVTNRLREHHEAGLLRARYRGYGLTHRCRVVVVTEFLTEPQMDELFRVATYYINTSHAEGACLPLMRALAGGRPGVAPAHTAMADYMDGSVGFVAPSDPEPTAWPHDPEQRLETTRHRLSWAGLRDALLASAEVADRDPARYAAMSAAARARMSDYASRASAESALRDALTLLPDAPAGGFDWAG